MARAPKSAPVRDPEDVYQRQNKAAVDTLADTHIVKGVLLTNIALTTGTTRVSHNLGRPAVGFKIVDLTADIRVWRDPDVLATASIIPLKASAAATVSLWVF